ncbi:MAG: restriction system protein [Actinomycetota bacterium]|nr:restriction system protein [Actinomycetota bacterium]
MTRRRGLASTLGQLQRDLARQQAARIRANAAAQREAERARKAYERASAADEKERRRLYLDSRSAKVDAMNEELDGQVAGLESLLATALQADHHLDFESLKSVPDIRPYDPGPLAVPEPPPDASRYQVAPLSGAKRLVPGAKKEHTRLEQEATQAYQAAVATHAQRESQRVTRWRQEFEAHQAATAALAAEAEQHDKEVEAFRAEFTAGDPDAVVSYFDLVLQRSAYPEGFPQAYRLAYVPESKQLVVEYQLPTAAVVPPVKAYKFMKTKDEVTSTPRAAVQIKSLYGTVVAQSTLRILHEVFEADRGCHVGTLVLNCVVDTVDPATGKAIRPVLVTVRTTRDVFAELDLSQVDPLACLRHLGAGVSKSPTELVPVRPVLEFDMVDKRFVQETDVLSGLDQRPNLMELSPGDFENLITNLFAKMGLETRLTQASRDGGVDCVAFDPRPIFGGKVVIQAKRYKGTVGVSAVRDLFGTVHNEGASKGILVTTSGYGSASFEFANGKPLELLDGTNLLYLLAEHAGIEARIEPPADWVDPAGADTT